MMNMVLSNPTIGLICSPKNPLNLFERMPEIAPLVDKVKATGRCKFMEGDYRVGSHSSEVIQASDLVVTLLVGGTVALESYLCNRRTVYLDLEGLYSFPEYENGRDIIVFDDLSILIDAISDYRKNKYLHRDLGSIDVMGSAAAKKDLFRDGKAAKRIGNYVSWLLGGFETGLCKKDAIKIANKKYAEKWGSENVVA